MPSSAPSKPAWSVGSADGEKRSQPTGDDGIGPDSRTRRRRARTPTLLQMEAVECGAAALGVVLSHYGKFVPLEQLRRECGVSRDGSNAASLLRAARAHGMEAKGFQMEADVARTVATPFIVFWNFNHFMVIEGFGRRKVYVNDPSMGPRKIDYEEFDDSFTGILLGLRPGEGFERGGRPANSAGELRDRLAGNRRAIALIVFVSLLLAIGGLGLPGFQRVFFDRVLAGGAAGWVAPMVGVMLFLALLLLTLTWVQQRLLLRLETRMSILPSAGFLEHI